MEAMLWTYPSTLDASDLEGLDVEATDGSIGTIDEATYDVGASYIVVDTGPWIFGRKVVVPASAIDRIDIENRTAYLGFTKDQIKDSPELGVDLRVDEDYRTRSDSYYGSLS
jgi:hypothetical protein